MDNIECDKRHALLITVDLPSIIEKRFPRWGMRIIQQEDFGFHDIEYSLMKILLHLTRDDLHMDIYTKVLQKKINLASQLHFANYTLKESAALATSPISSPKNFE